MTDFYNPILELICRASTQLPADVEAALREAANREELGSTALAVMATILENIDLARDRHLPMCQDTGTIHFFVECADDFPRRRFRDDACRAVVEATARGVLRQNCVESLSGRNTGDNLGYVNPVFHWQECDRTDGMARVTVLLKGGGSENVGRQYTLPDEALGAGRERKEDKIDLSVGIVMKKRLGDRVKKGEPLLTMHVSEISDVPRAEALAREAFRFTDTKPETPELIRGVVE